MPSPGSSGQGRKPGSVGGFRRRNVTSAPSSQALREAGLKLDRDAGSPVGVAANSSPVSPPLTPTSPSTTPSLPAPSPNASPTSTSRREEHHQRGHHDKRNHATHSEADDLALCLPLLGIAFILSAALLVGLLYSEGMIGGSGPEQYGGHHGNALSPEDPSVVAARKYGGRKVRDTQLRLPVTLRDLYVGRERQVEVRRREVCPMCHGDGADPDAGFTTCPQCHGRGVRSFVQNFGGYMQRMQSQCNYCGGKGRVPAEKCSVCHGQGHLDRSVTLNATIVPGMQDGEALRFPLEGNQHPNAAPGDVYLYLQCESHRQFSRKGDHLETKLSISLVEALTGFRHSLPHLDGHLVEVSKTTVSQPDEVVEIIGEGMPMQGTSMRGNLYVTLSVRFPHSLNKAQRAAVKDIFP